MKVFFLTPDISGAGPVWTNLFWAHYNAIASAVPTVCLSTPFRERHPMRTVRAWQNRQERIRYAAELQKTVLDNLDPNGPNLLINWTLSHNDILRARCLEPIWDKFSHKVLAILDTMRSPFIQSDVAGRYDRLTCFCADQTAELQEVIGTKTLWLAPHTDVLKFQNARAHRPIDLLVVGRRWSEIHEPLHFHFNAPERETISLDYVSRTASFSTTAEKEFGLVMGTHARAKISFCFEPSNIPRFQNRSPFTERWAHSWASGCTVVGTAPKGTGTADLQNWKEATFELPDTPAAAIELVEGLLADTEGLRQRRFRNIAEAAAHHDTRHRLRVLLEDLNIPLPDTLTAQLAELSHISETMRAQI